jgi:hypothetical protein
VLPRVRRSSLFKHGLVLANSGDRRGLLGPDDEILLSVGTPASRPWRAAGSRIAQGIVLHRPRVTWVEGAAGGSGAAGSARPATNGHRRESLSTSFGAFSRKASARRTAGVDTIAIPAPCSSDMAKFPLRRRRRAVSLIASSSVLRPGVSPRHWLQDRGNHIWDEWAHPRALRSRRGSA